MTDNKKTLDKLPKSAEDTAREIYNLARVYAVKYVSTHPSTYLDVDDLTQEGMIAYLQGRDIRFGIIDAVREATSLKRPQYGKIPTPEHIELNEDVVAADTADPDKTVLLTQIWDKLATDFPSRTYDIMHRRFKLGHTLKQIGDHHSLTDYRISQIIDATIDTLRRRLNK